MKRLFLLLLFLGCSGAAAARNPYIALQGAAIGDGAPVVSQPRTVIGVDVTVERDQILCGPYARYAQKYLGVRAPLTDKVSWSIEGASVSLLDAGALLEASAPAAPTQQVVSLVTSDEGFVRLQPDKVDMTAPTLEDAARAAAKTIFSLRRHRLELITGEAGEYVFGEGLRAALEEIGRLEQSYLELFLGKHVVTSETHRYTVYPQADRKQYVFCRFSAADGLLPESDLSGDMVVLQIDPSTVDTADIEADAKARSFVKCRVAAPSTCTVVAGGREYARTVVPVFEFGRSVNVVCYGK